MSETKVSVIEKLAREHGIEISDPSLNLGQGKVVKPMYLTELEAFAKAYAEATQAQDVPPDEYDIVVDTGDGIYHTVELMHFQQHGSKRMIQARLLASAPKKGE